MGLLLQHLQHFPRRLVGLQAASRVDLGSELLGPLKLDEGLVKLTRFGNVLCSSIKGDGALLIVPLAAVWSVRFLIRSLDWRPRDIFAIAVLGPIIDQFR